MSLINTVIPPQSFEIVRDRLGRIIADELDNQFQISYNPDLKVKNWIERFLQFDKTELPSVNVMFSEGSYGGQTTIQSDGTYKYYVDCYVNAKSRENDPGDVRAMVKLQRLLGVCRAIVEDPRNKTLQFGVRPGFVMSRHVESIQIQNPNQKEHDADSSVMGRLVVSVKVPETTSYIQPVNVKDFFTTIKLADTEMGYLWIDNNNTRYFDSSFDGSFE